MDRLFGGNDNDVLKGGAGNDHLSGQSGKDRLIGGGGGSDKAIYSVKIKVVDTTGNLGKDVLKSTEKLKFGSTTYTVNKALQAQAAQQNLANDQPAKSFTAAAINAETNSADLLAFMDSGFEAFTFDTTTLMIDDFLA